MVGAALVLVAGRQFLPGGARCVLTTAGARTGQGSSLPPPHMPFFFLNKNGASTVVFSSPGCVDLLVCLDLMM